MPNYDFLNLSPIDFEDLSRDLLQKHLDVHLESFASGRDSGIDLRYSKDDQNSIIVQCKRYKNFSNLKSNLKKETKNVSKLNPERYILTTSVALTPTNKTEIKKLFHPFIKNTPDIFGNNDMNNLLGKYPEIEKQHFKLWLQSIAVLDSILNRDIINRSDFEKEKIENDLKVYVKNDSFNEAIEILNDNNLVLISGIPGIGKTILARILVYNYLKEGFELVQISEDISEAEKLFISEDKQVFFYDDFLGTNFLEDRLNKNEDHRLISFMQKINKSPNKKFIMTTREYILNQAEMTYELFTQTRNLDLAKCIIDLEKYTRLIRAKILYNHLFYNNVPEKYIRNLLQNNRYLSIINHSNYNPRIIQYFTEKPQYESVTDDDYFEVFIKNLDNPMHIWEHSYCYNITEASRNLLLVLFMLGDPVSGSHLKESYLKLTSKLSEDATITKMQNDYEQSLKELEDTFITIIHDGESELIIQFQNPSIKDYLLTYLQFKNDLIQILIDNVVYLNQLFVSFSINTDEERKKIILNEQNINLVIDKAINNFENLKIIDSGASFYKGELLDVNFKEASDIKKMYLIAKLFENHLDQYPEVKKFIIKGLDSQLSIEESLNCNDLDYLIAILKIVREHYKKDCVFMVNFYLKNVNDIIQFRDLEWIGQLYPTEFQANIVKITELVVDKIYWVLPGLEEMPHSELWELYYEIEDMESNSNMNFDDIKNEIEIYIDTSEPDYDPADYELDTANEKSEDSLTNIADMFKTLV